MPARAKRAGSIYSADGRYNNIVYCARYDEALLVSGSHDATLQMWNFQHGETYLADVD